MTQTTTQAPTVESMSQRLTSVEQQVRDLQAAIAPWQERRNGIQKLPLSLDDPAVEIARGIAVEMFGGKVEAEVESDPEDPSYEFVVFSVQCCGDPADLVQRQLHWHERVEQTTGGAGRGYRLVLYPPA